MSDDSNVPLTPEERAELERLRAEKARSEREELERLRTEERREDGRRAPDATQTAAKRVTAASDEFAATAQPERAVRSFGQRMVLSGGEDADGMPAMPPAQKIIIAVCLICVVVALVWIVLSNARII